MQKDVVLRFEKLCNLSEVMECSDYPSRLKVMEEHNGIFQMKEIKENETTRPQYICEVAVPITCYRIKCFHQDTDQYAPCRLQALVQSQQNESGFWMKLPCSQCSEVCVLNPVTKEYVYHEDVGRD